MTRSHPPVFARHDTFFGVCEAIGQDFGFNPNYLRLAFALTILFAPMVVIGTYLGAGVVVALSRWIFPSRRIDSLVPVETAKPLHGDNDEGEIALASAA